MTARDRAEARAKAICAEVNNLPDSEMRRTTAILDGALHALRIAKRVGRIHELGRDVRELLGL